MSRVIWTPQAAESLRRLYVFLRQKDENQARKAIAAVRKAVLILERFPQAGRPSDDLEPEQRELLIPFGFSGYVLLYALHGNHAYVVAIRHQKEAGYGE